ncbi:MAG: peroxide stress protein YaaA [Planctomycetota bacterium]|jgi:cytoplasmic iron level regulating protein YaaA (DUF328/UPF0246 family)
MLAVLSPAKTMNMERAVPAPRPTQPVFLAEAEQLVDILRNRTPAQLAKLMGISADLARLNADRYARWSVPFTAKNAIRAILAFDGDVYRGFDVESLDRESLAFAQRHLRILSGLYGVLRPLDLIQAYRLEMGTRLAVDGAKSLHEFWGRRVTKSLRRELGRHASPMLVNLASNEYFRAVRADGLGHPVVTPVFKQRKGRTDRVVPVLSKQARGMMARFIVEQRVDEPAGLRDFAVDRYRYDARSSTDEEPVFVRKA